MAGEDVGDFGGVAASGGVAVAEYYPAFLAVLAGKSATNLAKPEARAVMALAPISAHVSKLTKPRVAAALRRAGRQPWHRCKGMVEMI